MIGTITSWDELVLGDFSKVFARTERELQLREIRVGVLTTVIVLSGGFLAGLLLSLLPWISLILIRYSIMFLARFNANMQALLFQVSGFNEYVMVNLPYICLLPVAGIGLASMRRYSTRKNKYFVLQLGESVDFRFGWHEPLAIAMLSGIFYLFSETAVYFSVLTPLVAFVASIIWQFIHDLVIKLYAVLVRAHSAEVVLAVWNLLGSFDTGQTRIQAIAACNRGRVVALHGSFTEEIAVELSERLPKLVVGLDQVVIVRS